MKRGKATRGRRGPGSNQPREAPSGFTRTAGLDELYAGDNRKRAALRERRDFDEEQQKHDDRLAAMIASADETLKRPTLAALRAASPEADKTRRTTEAIGAAFDNFGGGVHQFQFEPSSAPIYAGMASRIAPPETIMMPPPDGPKIDVRITTHGAPARFAPLAESMARALADPVKQMLYPVHLAVLNPKAPRKAVQNSVERHCADFGRVLRRASKIVLEPDFTELSGAVSREPPQVLYQLLATARMPHEELWLEWPEPVRQRGINPLWQSDPEAPAPDRVGLLIHPAPEVGPTAYVGTLCSGYGPDAGPSPVGLAFSFHEPIQDANGDVTGLTRLEDAEASERFTGLGRGYLRYVAQNFPDQFELGKRLAQHAASTTVEPMGAIHTAFIKAGIARGREDIQEAHTVWLRQCSAETDGTFRWLLVALALLQTHHGGELLANSTPKTGKQVFVRGKFLPKYEYRVVTLVRPQHAPDIVRGITHSPGIGRREHDVIASWHHQRAPVAACTVHPQKCTLDGRAHWSRVVDPDTGEGVGSDQQRCTWCGRKRWHVPEHVRGDRKLGRVEKGFEVTASMKARDHSFRTEEKTSG